MTFRLGNTIYMIRSATTGWIILRCSPFIDPSTPRSTLTKLRAGSRQLLQFGRSITTPCLLLAGVDLPLVVVEVVVVELVASEMTQREALVRSLMRRKSRTLRMMRIMMRRQMMERIQRVSFHLSGHF